MIVMPPIEWPTSTTGPSGDDLVEDLLAGRWPSWSMVALPSVERPERPCERWS